MSDDIREQARKRIKARRDFWQMLAIFVVIAILLNIIWLTTGGVDTYYWPMWPMIGFALATVFSALSTFGPFGGPITDAHVDAEIRRMGGDSGASK